MSEIRREQRPYQVVSISNLNQEKLFNKMRMSKVGAISNAQKAQNNFLEKKLEIFEKIFFQKKSHSAQKFKRGTLLDLLTYILFQNIKNLEGGTLWGH